MTMHPAPAVQPRQFDPSDTSRMSAAPGRPKQARTAAREGEGTPMSAAADPPSDLLKRALNEINHGVLLVTQAAELRYANRAAARALLSTPGLNVVRDRLQCCDPRDQQALLKALAACRGGRRSMLSVSVDRTDPIQLAVVPIGLPAQGNCDDIVALVTLGKRQGYDALGLQFFAQTHQLTTAEGRVLQRLCEGLCATEIAAHGGVALSTVRSQIRSICQKTQASSIRALLGLVNMLPPMACAFDGSTSDLVSA